METLYGAANAADFAISAFIDIIEGANIVWSLFAFIELWSGQIETTQDDKKGLCGCRSLRWSKIYVLASKWTFDIIRTDENNAGRSRLLRAQRMLAQHLFAFSTQEFRRRSDFHQAVHWIGQKQLKS